jgi:hypothetical protein
LTDRFESQNRQAACRSSARMCGHAAGEARAVRLAAIKLNCKSKAVLATALGVLSCALWNVCEAHEPISVAALHQFWRRRGGLFRANATSRRRFAAQAFASRPRAAATYARAPRGLRHKRRSQTAQNTNFRISAVVGHNCAFEFRNLTQRWSRRRGVRWPGGRAASPCTAALRCRSHVSPGAGSPCDVRLAAIKLNCKITACSRDRFRCLFLRVWSVCESHEPISVAALHQFWRRRRGFIRANAKSRRRFAAQAFASRPRAAATYTRAPRGLRHKRRWQAAQNPNFRISSVGRSRLRVRVPQPNSSLEPTPRRLLAQRPRR